MLSYIILFTDEYRYAITLVFLLSHFTLKFCIKTPPATRGVPPSCSRKGDGHTKKTQWRDSQIDFEKAMRK
jgi:hypothetical protein